MGLDQDFYMMKKTEKYEVGHIFGYSDMFYPNENNIIDYKKPKFSEIVSFRKEYELSEIITEVTGGVSGADSIIIDEEQLKQIYQKVWDRYLKLCHKDKLNSSEKDDITSYYYITKVLSTIINLFNFSDYYLLYCECG